MDSLKSLMDKKEYEIVLKVTASAEDASSIFYRISALVALGRGNDALTCLLEKRDILKNKLPLLIKVHFELLTILEKWDEAYDEIEYYQNLPYESQEVEEMLKELPKYVREAEKNSVNHKNFSDDQINKLLMSEDQNDVIAGIDLVRGRTVEPFIDSIKNILTNYPKQSIRSFALLLLVQKQISGVFEFDHMDEAIQVEPTKLEPPFIGQSFNNLVKKMDKIFKDPALAQNAVQILSSYIIYIYPEKIMFDDETLIEALYHLSSSYLQEETSTSIEQRCLAKGLNVAKVEDAIHLIKTAIEDF